MEDSTIVKKIIDRDETALADVEQYYGKYMKSIARGILKDERDAEECVSDAVMKAWDNVPAARPADLRSYLGMLTRSVSISRSRMNGALRRGGEYEMVPSDELEALVGDNDVPEGVEADELAGVISAFLRGRGTRERNIFIRRYWFGDRVSDIAAVFNSNDTFFDKFSVDDNGVWYFSYPDGAQYSYYYNFDFTEEELNGLVLDEETGTGWLRTHNRGMYDVYYRNEEVTIAVSFVWDNGWKLAELNTADAALREYASGFAATEFSADNARRVITTVLCDLYMWAHVDTEGLIEVALFDAKLSKAPKQVYRGARQYTRVTGTLSAPWIWSGYARRFMTDALADRLFSSGDYLLFTDDAVYSWAGYASDRSAFGDYGIERAQLEVLSANDTRATVRLAGWRYSDNVMDLDFEFELVNGVWKISGGNFIDTLDAIFASPETGPYPADADPSLIPPAPGNASRRSNYFLFRHGFDNAYNLTTYQDIHLKPGEALKIPVLWFRNEPLPEGTYELIVEFEPSDSVRFELLSKDEAPECEVCFVATALKSGRATVRLYGSFDPDKLDSEALKGISNYPNAPNMLIDVVLTIYVDN